MTGNAVVVNFSGGETSPRSRARFDQPWYQTSAKKMLNFIAEIQGPARFRPGTVYGYQTRLGAVARSFDFEISDVLTYLLEFTPGYLRIRNPLTLTLLTTTQAAITGITQATTAVVTVSSATGLSNGKEVVLSGVTGMPQLNNKQFLIANLSGSTFNLADPVTGATLNTSAYTSAATAGAASVVYELTTPYSALDLQSVQVAAADGIMYLVCPRQVPQKLTVDAYGNFSINSYSRINDPFALSALAVTISDVRPVYIEDQRLGIGGTITPGADTGSGGIAFTSSNQLFTAADVGKYIRCLIAQSDTRSAAGATLSAAATTGVGIVFTASAAVFAASDVGGFIRDLSAGAGVKGYAQIVGFTDNKHVICNILSTFASTSAIAPTAWEITSTGYAYITGFNSGSSVVCEILQSFGSTASIAAGNWAIVTVETQVTLAANSVVNASSTYVISSVGGATGINGGTYYLVAIDVYGTTSGQRFYARTTVNGAVDSSGSGVYTSGGVATPSGSQASITLTGISLGTTTIVTFAAGAVVNPNVGYTFSGISGTTQLNGATYWLKTVNGQVQLTLVDGTPVNSSAWTTYVSGGIATASAENPISVAFYEGRLVFAGTNQRPDCLFLSMSPDPTTGNSQYDNFTGGSADNYACFFQLAPTGGSTSFISWARGGPDYLFIGTFGGPYRVSGSGLDIPITPSSINVRQFDTAGAEETVPAGLQQMFFVQRAGATVRSIKVINPYLATFESADVCLNAEQIGYSPIQRVLLQRGRPDALWVFRADGVLAGMSVHITAQNADTLTGWHRHQIAGGGKVVDIAVVPRQNGFDQLWCVVQRTINGASRCYFEVMADDVTFPDPEDFYQSSGPVSKSSDNPNNVAASVGSKAGDLANWKNAVWRLQANYIHVDSALTYDGSLRGVTAGATLTPSAVGAVQVEGQAPTYITLTASQAVFLASDVGSEIWVKPDPTTGFGAGRALITAYTDSEHVTATVSVPFSSATAFAAGDWYFAVSTFYGYGHLEGQQVAAVGDGGVISDGGQTGDSDFPTLTVAQGTISLPAGDLGQPMRAAVFHAGQPYLGFVETHNLEMGGKSGPAQSKPRNITDIRIRFMNSLGCEYGTDLYAMDKIDHRLSDATYDRPAPVFSGLRRVKLEDSWSGLDDATREKNVFVTQRLPLPAVVQFLDLDYATADDGGTE